MVGFPIDFIRQIIEQTLYEEHLKNTNYFGGTNQVNLMSFYEQLEKEEQIDRYANVYRDLVNQQNRTGLIMNGTIVAPENPTITNLHQSWIIPLTFTCSFRVALADRDMAIKTINNLIFVLKGRKRDIAEFDTGKLLVVGTVANNVSGNPTLSENDYIGFIDELHDVNTRTLQLLSNITTALGVTPTLVGEKNYYVTHGGKLRMVKYNSTSQEYELSGIGIEHNSYVPYKVSMSFDSIRCDEPRTLNAKEYCVISFGGSATICSKEVLLGNDLTKMSIKKYKLALPTNPTYTITHDPVWLEPLEMPSGNNANTRINQLISNKFVSNTHTDNLNINVQYTFVLDFNISLLRQWFEYARYGTQANGTLSKPYASGITPNMVYQINEIWSYWGTIRSRTVNAKIVESIDIENTESDTLTITIPFQMQGDNI